MPKQPTVVKITYEELARLTGKPLKTIYGHVSRGYLNINKLDSVILYVCRQGTKGLRLKCMDALLRGPRSPQGPPAR